MKKYRLVVITVLVISVLVYTCKKYKEYQGYNTKEIRVYVGFMNEFLRGYMWNYFEYPSDGNQFIEYLENNRDFKYFVEGIKPYFMKRNGLGILQDSTNNKIVLFAYNSKKREKKAKPITDISFFEYMMGSTHILLSEDHLMTICDAMRSQVVLFKNNEKLENDSLRREIKRRARHFRIRHSEFNKEPLYFKDLYYQGVFKQDSLRFNVVCDSFNGEINTELIADSLALLFYDLELNNLIDEMYIPLTLSSSDEEFNEINFRLGK